MVVPWSRWVGRDDLYTAVWGIVCSLALFTIVVTDIVGILLVKLQTETSNFACIPLLVSVIVAAR
jgi:hypothetical protein